MINCISGSVDSCVGGLSEKGDFFSETNNVLNLTFMNNKPLIEKECTGIGNKHR